MSAQGREPYLPAYGSLDHLRADAPYLICSGCLRRSWSSEVGDGCWMSQPDGSRCEGEFVEARPE